MSSPGDRLRQSLSELLQEDDPARYLDSLERVAVLAYLTGSGFCTQPPDPAAMPVTIEGWVEWVEHSSKAS